VRSFGVACGTGASCTGGAYGVGDDGYSVRGAVFCPELFVYRNSEVYVLPEQLGKREVGVWEGGGVRGYFILNR